MAEPVLEDNTSSYSGTTLGSSDTEPQDTGYSDIDYDYVPSETSEDRAFIASDTEDLSCCSDRTSDSEKSVQNILDEYLMDRDEETTTGREKRPVKAIARRTLYRNGSPETQYLVLWYSWESFGA
ncbi:hypothetical protein N7523_010261, partial [Penicillium sp. IBT 18751x]